MIAPIAPMAALALALSPAQDPPPATIGRPGEARLAALVSEASAQANVRTLCAFGPRMGGTASGTRAAAWLARAFEQGGLAAEVVLDDEHWCHSETAWRVTASVTGDGSEEALTIELASAWPYGFSPTAKGRALLATKDGEDAALLLERWRRGTREARVVLVDGVTSSDPERKYAKVLHLSERADNPQPVFGLSAGDGARLREWLGAGRAVVIEYALESEIRRARPRTVVATLPARTGAPPGFLLYCAHGDSDAGGPGADDNASGAAVVLEIASAWARAIREGLTPPPAREVRFAVWGSEIHSTRTFLRERIPEDAPILGVINYDQAGFGSGADQLNIEPDDLPANRRLIAEVLGVLADFGGTAGFPERWATNKSLGGTDSYVFSGSKAFKAGGLPALTLFTSAWDKPDEQPRTKGMPGESWSDRDVVNVDYDVYYHSAGDTPENTTDKEPWNMGWCARVGLLAGRRWLDTL